MRSLWGQMRSFICREVKQLAWGHVVRLYRSSNKDWHRVFPDLSLVITLCIQLLLCWYHYVLWQSFPGFLSVLVDFYFGAGLASLVWIPWFSLGKNHSCILGVCVFSRFRHVWFFMTPWTVVHQAPLSMGFSGQEYWSGLPCPPPGDRPHPGIEPVSLASPALAGGFFTTSALVPPGEPLCVLSRFCCVQTFVTLCTVFRQAPLSRSNIQSQFLNQNF